MEKYIRFILYASCMLWLFACSDKEPVDGGENQTQLSGVYLSLEGMNADLSTKAVTDYAVNTTDDPTHTMIGRELWNLDVVIYKGDTKYQFGESTFNWDAVNSQWIPSVDIFFPNYTKQFVQVKLYEPKWTEIATDQSAIDGSAILEQDVLIQKGATNADTVAIINPAHIPEIEVKHAHSMLNFKLIEIDTTQISSVVVDIGGTEYKPYKIFRDDHLEYMLIVPVGTDSPIVKISTVGGAVYQQATDQKITNTLVNTCYCFTLVGFELALAEITIANWTTGPGIAGEYTLEQSYPTFRGLANQNCTVYFDNGLDQYLEFNEQGESTQKPVGRKIIHIETSTGTDADVSPAIVLSGMIVDLTGYF